MGITRMVIVHQCTDLSFGCNIEILLEPGINTLCIKPETKLPNPQIVGNFKDFGQFLVRNEHDFNTEILAKIKEFLPK